MRIEGVILDWAGTTIDYGCFAPVQVFIDVFEEIGIPVTMEEVRAPMGQLKRDHIQSLLQMPRIEAAFQAKFGRSYTETDMNELHDRFEPRLLAILSQYGKPNPYVVETVRQLRQQGLKIGATTGYTSTMLSIVAKAAKEYGYEPDHWVTPDLVMDKGRPYPYMIYENMKQLGLRHHAQVVKVGDTISDIQEANSAGVWAIGIVKGSSMLGLTEAEAQQLSPEEERHIIAAVSKSYMEAGAHAVIEDMSQLPAMIEQINERLMNGELPYAKPHQ
ncbi:phosphonoacetaldehyde hydrolase [Paenibacillus algorifonticola]|uniref:Phosphonoacetaldehyde hydrolase n=1 Tax=Paenibacillus algorifonticola TaxID=684063 RepID=A0A1I2EWB6_9BACL|nr:phosphonoacetaldehyde hydrolase [Paenibacillus algorifonticola]SFE96510.1 phosphonoacetaldehyde hydrolase [Paenibacillus algorifonticola]